MTPSAPLAREAAGKAAPRDYYNEHDPKAAAWLRELIAQGHVAPGDVDTRDIREVQPDELKNYRQVHLFAGVGGWSHALRLAHWPDDRAVWTGSCPCPPFSAAGKKKACPVCQGKPIPHPRTTGVFACVQCAHEWHADDRHLWPEMLRLVSECRPAKVFGEQVSGPDGLIWFAGVRATLEAVGYGVGGLDTCAAGVGSPHIRQRLYWVADATGRGLGIDRGARGRTGHTDERGEAERMVNSIEPRLEGLAGDGDNWHQPGWLDTSTAGSVAKASATRGLALADGGEPGNRNLQRSGQHGQQQEDDGTGFWSAFDLIPCRDNKVRRVEPGTFPLADGVPFRVVKLRGFGNAIVPDLAAKFIEATERGEW